MIKERVIQVIEYKKIAKEDFYTKIGMTSASFRGNARKTPLNSNAIENILSEIPDVNPTWLLTGQGEMLRKEDSDPKDHLSDVGDMVSLEEYKAQVKAATRLEIQLEQYQERVKALEKTVDQLKSAGSGVGRKELK